MAHLKGPLGWLVAALLLCGTVALAYLPPRGISREARVTLSGVMTGPPTDERLRANERAKEWRRAALDVRLHEWRARLAPDLAHRRSANKPTLVVTIDTSWPPAARARAARSIDEAWEALELGTTKIGIAVVIEPEQVAAGAAARRGTAHLLPDSSERHTCVAWTAPRPAMGSSLEKNEERSAVWHAQWARTLLGPCAFYARFGRPSTEVERWLALRQHRFAQLPAWDSTWSAVQRRERSLREPMPPRVRAMQRALDLRTLPPLVLGCMAGRATACRAAVLGDAPRYGTVPRLITGVAERELELPGSIFLLSDMVREFGSARFARFWISDLAPDSAFTLAMDTTLGDWVLSRQHAYGATLVTGPTPTLGAGAFGLGVAALGMLLAILTATKRQVA